MLSAPRGPWAVARTLLGCAIVLKGLTWPAVPTSAAALLALGGLAALTGRWQRVGFAIAASVGATALVSGHYYANHVVLLTVLSALAVFVPHHTDDAELHPSQLLLMAQVTIVYFWAGAWKVNAAFLSGSVLLFEWDHAWLHLIPRSPVLAAVLAVATVLLEIGVAALLWARRWAHVGVGVALLLHAGMFATVGTTWVVTAELAVFALLCGSSFPLFLQRRSSRVDAQVDRARTFS